MSVYIRELSPTNSLGEWAGLIIRRESDGNEFKAGKIVQAAITNTDGKREYLLGVSAYGVIISERFSPLAVGSNDAARWVQANPELFAIPTGAVSNV